MDHVIPPPEPRIDGCPECVVNTELPHSTTRTTTGWLSVYRCADCGHAWSTSWRD